LYYGQYGITINLENTYRSNSVFNGKRIENFKKEILNHKEKKMAKEFKHDMNKHISYGLTFETDEQGAVKSASVKMFTYPSVKSVEMQFCEDGDDEFLNDYKSEIYSRLAVKTVILNKENQGIFSKTNINIKPHNRYRYKLIFENGEHRYISDLYSYEQKSLLGWPVAYNQDEYKHSKVGLQLAESAEDWATGLINGKVNNIKAGKYSNYIYSNQLRMLQVHIGTFTKEGTFGAAAKKIDHIKSLGFNGIELMPHGFFYNENWGYDPNFIFAAQYGGTDEFKMFCDVAHKNGLNVIVDLVNNHYSMDCPDILTKAGPYANENPAMGLPFGPRFNYDGENSEEVREWRINEALYWLQYADGIRFDLTDFTASGGFNTQLNIEIQEHFKGTVTFAESESQAASTSLPENAVTSEIDDIDRMKHEHDEIIKKAQNNEFGINNQGFTHRWHFNWSHAVENSILNKTDRNLENLKAQILDAQKHMKIFLSHDEIGKGEADGNSMIVKIMLSELFGYDFCVARGSYQKLMRYQMASRSIRELTKRYLTGEPFPSLEQQLRDEKAPNNENIYDIYSEFFGIADYEDGGFSFKDLGLTNGISEENFENLFNTVMKLYKAGLGFLYSQPGPKMMFQSFSHPENRFAFFRKNSPDFYKEYARKYNLSQDIDWETVAKGHAINSDLVIKEANLEGLGNKYTSKAIFLTRNLENLVKALNRISDENYAISLGSVKNVIGYHKDAIAIHSKYNDNEIFAITHFDMQNSYSDYGISFPEGEWQEILNTNSSDFGGSGKFLNSGIFAGGIENKIKLEGASTVIFKRKV
jgi:1,4-alpha-glucan branching enzyme